MVIKMEETKTVAVIGANGGIGRKAVDRLRQEGYRCIAVDKEEQVRELESEDVETVWGDMLSDTVAEQLQEVMERQKRIYGVVFAAGIMIPGRVSDLEAEDWNRTMETNLTSVFKLTKTMLPYLLQNKSSHMIAIASHLGVVGSYDLAAYSVSKAGLIEFIKCMALDYGGCGLLANCISPGFIKTKMLDKAMGKFACNKKWMFATGGLPRQHVDVNDVVHMISFLLSQESMNGENIIMDAGYSVR